MLTSFKQIASYFLIPLVKFYLRRKRRFTYDHVRVTVHPGVFHPGLFHSTKFLLEYIKEQHIQEKKILELGCGTGLISIISAKAGGIVTASDLSSLAIQNIAVNAEANKASIKIVQSDLFDKITGVFDFIIINPPYYKGIPKNEVDLAWYCGEDFEYFQKLFKQLPDHIRLSSEIIMVLTKGCNIDQITAIAGKNGFEFTLLREKNVLFDEKDFLFRIRLNHLI